MSTGTACVATDAGADGEVLENGAGIVISTQGVTTQLRTLLPVLRDQPVLTSELGKKSKSTPMGSLDHPFNPLSLALGSGATFVARTLDRESKHLGEIEENVMLTKEHHL